MAKEKGSGKSDSPPPILERLADDDWGNDWESAFKSDDLEHDEGELADEFSFDDEADQDAAAGPSPADEAATGDDEEGQPGGGTRLLATLFSLAARLRQYGKNLSRPRKIAAGAALLTLAAALLLYGSLSRPPTPHDIVLPDDPFGLRQDLASSPPVATPPPIDPAGAPAPTRPPAPPPRAAEPDPPPPPPEPERRRLSLAGFFIPVTGDTEHGDVFLHLDLTLTIQVPPDEEPDPMIEPQLRESVYDFYQRRDPATLRRYSLARGDMLRDLRLWLEEQQPELAADAIAFDRYWIN